MGQELGRGERAQATAAPRAPVLHLILVVILAGAGTMTVELAAVRLLAPWFGTSSRVWTNVIGVVLLALALGYLLGARLSRHGDARRRLGRVLLVAALCSSLLPFGARPVAELFLPPELALDQAAGLLLWGSLGAAFVLFLPAAAALGCVGPLAVEELQRLSRGGAGDAGGRVLAASTLGSLFGTFGTTHLFIPELGLRVTFLGSGLLLALSGLSLLFPRPGRGSLAAGALVLVAFALPAHSQRRPSGERRLLERVESPLQHLEVVELDPSGSEGTRLRMLQVNESFDSFQSVWVPRKGLLGAGYYYDYFAAPMHWDALEGDALEEGGGGRPWRVLILGLGAGTSVRVLEGSVPRGLDLATVGVEIDPAVVELGRRWFDLAVNEPGRTVLSGLDARAALRALPGPFDQVVLDCYANNMEIPPHLSTGEFFSEVAGVLRPGGWISANVGGFGVGDPVVQAVAKSLAAGTLSPVACARVPFSRNVMLYARPGSALPQPGGATWGGDDLLAGLTAPLEVGEAWRVVRPPVSAPLTDDRCAIERLQLESIAAGRRRFLRGSVPR